MAGRCHHRGRGGRPTWRGAAGGAIDTVAEVNAAIAAGRITVKGQTATASVFVISEENVAGVWYVRVALKAYGSMISIR
jgi:hypothetical protein